MSETSLLRWEQFHDSAQRNPRVGVWLICAMIWAAGILFFVWLVEQIEGQRPSPTAMLVMLGLPVVLLLLALFVNARYLVRTAVTLNDDHLHLHQFGEVRYRLLFIRRTRTIDSSQRIPWERVRRWAVTRKHGDGRTTYALRLQLQGPMEQRRLEPPDEPALEAAHAFLRRRLPDVKSAQESVPCPPDSSSV